MIFHFQFRRENRYFDWQNGAGKSTTLRSIIGLVKLTEKLYNDTNIVGLPTNKCRTGIALVPEGRRTFRYDCFEKKSGLICEPINLDSGRYRLIYYFSTQRTSLAASRYLIRR